MDRISLNAVLTNHFGQSSTGLSPRLWSRIRNKGTGPDGTAGFFVGDDFLKFQGFSNAISGTTALPSTTVPAPDGYQIYADSATSASGISRSTTLPGGVAVFAPGVTDNHLVVINSGIACALSDTAGSDKLTVFECRVALNTAVATGSAFVGLATTTVTADGGLIADTGGLIAATGAGIGFRTLDADPDGWDAIYKQNSSGTEQVVHNEAQVAVADTFYKLGFVYDPAEPASRRVKFFVDNTELSSYVTATNIADSAFPDGTMLAPTFGVKSDGGSASRGMLLDWWALFQEA